VGSCTRASELYLRFLKKFISMVIVEFNGQLSASNRNQTTMNRADFNGYASKRK
jgi:hypothetical protein